MSNVLVHEYTPRGSALKAMHCRDSELLLSGPAGTGKSRACMEKLHLLALLNPGMRGLIVRKTLASLASTALTTWRHHVVPEPLSTGDVVWYGGSAQDPPQYQYANGSVVVVGGLDKPSRIMSSEYDVIYVQEATELTVTDWEALTTRLRNWRISFQQLIADCNPDKPSHWLKVRCDSGSTNMMNSRHEDNPVLFDDDGSITPSGISYIDKLDKLTGVRYLRLRKGIWAAAEGLIYEDEWDADYHIIDRFDIPESWPRWWSLDFGFTNPFVCSMWAEDPDGRLYMYREFYHTKKTVDVHCADIARVIMHEPVKIGGEWQGVWIEPRPRGIVADHDAEGREVFQRELGVSTIAANKKVKLGIQAVQERLKVAEDGKPRLFFMRDSLVTRDPLLYELKKPTCTVEEIVGYVWETSGDGSLKETPRKEDDHGMDTTRYIVADRDLSARPRVRFF